MAITKTELAVQGGGWLRAWTIIATLDADTAFTLVPAAPTGLTPGTPVVVVLTPLTAAGLLSTWVLSGPAYPATIAGFEITKSTAAGSGDPGAQLLVQMIAPPLLAIAHP